MFANAPVQARRLSLDGWSVDVPAHCADAVTLRRVAEKPVYTPNDAAQLRRDPMMILMPAFENMPAYLLIDLQPCFAGTELRISQVGDWLDIASPDRAPQDFMVENVRRLTAWVDNPEHVPPHQLPMLGFLHASPFIKYGQQRLTFPWGRGARLVTRFEQLADYLNPGMTYWFQALSTDNRVYVQMFAPLTLAALPRPNDDGQFGVNFGREDSHSVKARPLRKRLLQRIDDFLRSHEGEFVPELFELDRLVRSIQYQAPAD